MSFIHQKKTKQRLKKGLVLSLIIYIMIGASLYTLQEKILFRPTTLAQNFIFNFSQPFEELFLKTGNNSIINAIHFKAQHSKGVILYFHGNAGDLSRWGFIAEYFVERQYDVLVIDYRTYGKSTGLLSEEALYKDAQFCYEYLKNQYEEDEISVYGRSLGTGIATFIASNNLPKQLILETPYFNILDVAKHRFPLFPVKYLINYKLPSNEFIKKVSCPISIIHGTEDRVVPFDSGKKLSKVSSKESTKFITVEGGLHNNLIEFEAYHFLMDDILP